MDWILELAAMYVISRGGTFGVVSRRYVTEAGEPMVVIRWGPLGWLTPVREQDTRQLSSPYEAEAQQEARRWLETNNALLR